MNDLSASEDFDMNETANHVRVSSGILFSNNGCMLCRVQTENESESLAKVVVVEKRQQRLLSLRLVLVCLLLQSGKDRSRY